MALGILLPMIAASAGRWSAIRVLVGAGATSPASAVAFVPASGHERRSFETLLEKGIVAHAAPDLFYVDQARLREASAGQMRLIRAIAAAGAAAALLAILLLG